jgi:uracil-DNA glycosylase family 4
MESEFNQDDLDSLIKEALSVPVNPLHPKSGMHVGFMETDMLELLSGHLSNKIPLSAISEIYQDLRLDLLSRKSNHQIKDLHTVILNCRKCEMQQTTPELPKWNVKNPDVLFITDNPSLDSDSVSFFLSALKEAGFESSNVCLTYVNRCPVKRKYTNQEVFNCSPYLHNEIQLLNPKLIVTLGSVPLISLLGLDVKLKEYRGNLTWLGYWPIIPTYSPIYAVRNGQNFQDQFLSDIKSAHNFSTKD